MADDDAPNTPDDAPNNVRSLMGRVGFNPPSEGADSASSSSADAPTLTLPTVTDPPADDPDDDDAGPLDMLAAMPESGLAPATRPYPIAPQPGHVPDTFRAQPTGETNQTPRLGALSAAAILAISVAALRGIHSAVTAWRANREQRQAVEREANSGKGGKGKKDSSPDKSPSRRSSSSASGSGGGSGGGSGRKNRGGGRGSGGNGSGGSRNRSSSSRNGSSGGGGRSTSPNGKSRKDRTGPKPNKSNTRSLLGLGRSQGGNTLGRGNGKGKGLKTPTTSGGKKNSRRDKAPRGTSGSKGLLRSMRKTGEEKTGPKSKKDKTSSASATGSGMGRTTLRRAMKSQTQKAAKRRWKQRKKNMDNPFLWSAKPKDDAKDTRADDAAKKSAGGSTSTGGAAKTSTGSKSKKGPKTKKRSKGTGWEKTSARARNRWNKRRAAWPSGDPFDDGGDHWVFGSGPDGKRADPGGPFAAAGAASHPWRFHGLDREEKPPRPKEPGAVGRGQLALAAPPTPHTKRPGTSAPEYVGTGGDRSTKEKESPMAEAGSRAVAYASAVSAAVSSPEMSPEHETEITLPEALELLEKLTQDGFGAHDVCVRLAKKAREIRHKFEDLAADLKTRHNIIGRMTRAAMHMFAEAMEVVARKAEEMQITSLIASELSEVAENAMFDAYQPIQQATEDAGLAAPSAYVHNRE